MAVVVTFTGYRPSIREDEIPWTGARIEEGVSDAGPWVLLETVTLAPVDADPSNPSFRSFTTELGTGPNLWYRIVFVDGTGDQDAPTEPVQNVGDGVGAEGPCDQWITGLDVTGCCADATDASAAEAAARQAGELLFELSGRQFGGACGPVTVRPCRKGSICYVPWRVDQIRACGCAPLSEALLPGFPVREIASVKVDGEVVAPSLYRLDGHRRLVRLANADGGAAWWPSCQRLDLADTEERTFSVTYTYGSAAPPLGLSAAAALGCEIYKSCSGTGECSLPSGTTRVTRQGITVEREKITAFLLGGHTGIVLVDMFLATYGSKGARRRSAVWSPDGPRYAKQLG